MHKVAALYVTPDSVYKSLALESFDEYRDARSYSGWLPVVAHPPCRSWGRLRRFARPAPWERSLAVHAVGEVRRCGGVLEHPAGSLLWSDLPEFGAYPLPAVGAGVDAFGGRTFSVYQSTWGHPAPKHSWIYVVGALPGAFCKALEASRPGGFRKVSGQPAARRMDTPPEFASFLCALAESVQ